MAAPTCRYPAAVGTAAPETHAEEAKSIETIDVAKLKSLLDFVRERLTTDVYGNFSIQGDRLAKDGRHAKLREVVELNGLLQEVKGLLERKNKALSMDAPQESRKTGRPGASQVAVYRDMIKEELEKGLRDVKVENERLRERATKTEERMKKAEADHDALQESVRKLGSGQMRGVRGIVKEEAGRTVREIFDQTRVKERLTDTEKSVKKTAIEMEAQVRAVEETLTKRVSDTAQNFDNGMNSHVLSALSLVRRDMALLRQDYEKGKGKLSTEMLQQRTKYERMLDKRSPPSTTSLDSNAESPQTTDRCILQ